MNSIVIIDYGMGNLRSIGNKFKRLGIPYDITNDLIKIEKADKIVFPGVGHFKKAIERIKSLGLLEILNKKVKEDIVPILGICLGVQLFCKHSEEGDVDGLGWIDAEVVRFRIKDKLKYKVPHIGWNDVKIVNSNSLDKFVEAEDKFYFVHSYHINCFDKSAIWMVTNYEYEFVSAVHKDNIYGTQFHPEKSHDVGMELLKKFAKL